MQAPWKVILAFLGVFVAGAVFGGFFTLRASSKRLASEVALARNVANRPNATQRAAASSQPGDQAVAPLRGSMARTLMRQFTRLNLTPEQKKRIDPIVSRAAEDYQRLRGNYYADTARVTERMYADVAAELSHEQRVELEQMRKQLQERLEEERRRRIEAGTPGGRAGAKTNVPALPDSPQREP